MTQIPKTLVAAIASSYDVEAVEAVGIFEELTEFIANCLDNGSEHWMPEQLDTAWHHFVLHTEFYRDFCQNTFGALVEHVPYEDSKCALRILEIAHC